MIVPVAEFAPDMPDFPATTTDVAFNVVPSTPVSYGPCPSLQAFSTALTARCQGAIEMADNSGNVRVFAGDVSKLYRSTTGASFSDVSKGGGYSLAADQQWRFTQFGQRIIATDYADNIQSYVEGTSSLFADMITSGQTDLKARFVATVKDWVVFLNTSDGTNGAQPQRVWWSAINDPTSFPTPGTQAAANVLSDFQDNVGPHGRGMGIVGNLGSANAGVFYERAVFRMVYSGLPDIFDFAPAEGARGLLASGSLVQQGPIAFYFGEDGVYAFDGSSSRAIGKNKIDKFLLNDLQFTYLDRVSGAVDPKRGLIVWAYPGVGAVNGVANRLLFYSPFLDRFSITDVGAINAEYLIRGASFGKTLEQLDSFGTIDSLAYSLDSSVWTGGVSVLAGFDSSHKFGYFDGSNLAATVDTQDGELVPGRQCMVNFLRPLVDVSSATVATAARDRIADTVTYSSAVAIARAGTCPVRARGRYHRARIQVPAGASWTHISGVDTQEVQPLGIW